MSRKLTYQPKPKWCKGCKKTARVVRYKQDGAFVTRCRKCAESDGRTVVDNRANNGHKSTEWAKAARQTQMDAVDAENAMIRANQARRVKAAKRAKMAAERRKIALMEGMVGTDGLANHFRMNGVCRGCKGRLPVSLAPFVHRDAFVTPNKSPTVVCRGCAE
jgi:hypothetical protein